MGFLDLPLRMLVPCLVSLLLILCLQLLLTRTFLGRAIMAVAQDQLALQLMAADPVHIKRVAFAISIAVAGIAGALLIVIGPVEPSVGREYIGRVFAICVLGGMGSLPGTVIAAMLRQARVAVSPSAVHGVVGHSFAQALHLMNSEEISNKVRSRDGAARRLARSNKAPRDVIDELYLSTLSRYPNEKERALMLKFFADVGDDRTGAVEDVLWAILNTRGFVYNH